MDNTENAKYTQDDMRTEYTIAANYHNATIGIRFTIVGFYITATSVVAPLVLSTGVSWRIRAVAGFLGALISGMLWIMDLRIRTLYTTLAHRCIEIERHLWGIEGSHWYEGTFSRLFKTCPLTSYPRLSEVPKRPDRDWPDALELKRVPQSWRPYLSVYISHSIALSILYLGGFLVWLGIFATSVCKIWPE